MDAARERLASIAKYKVVVIPKTKLCEALKASDFACDVLLDESQAQLLARFLNVNAYTTGTLERAGVGLVATIRVRDIGGSGYAALFPVSSGNPGTAAALGEAIAQRLNTIVLAGEPQNTNLRLGIAELLRQQKQYQRAVSVLDDGLARSPSDQKLVASKQRICIEGELWRCVVDGFVMELKNDTAKGADSAWVKAAIGAAQQISDTTNLLLFARTATRHFPKSAAFWEALGTAFDLKGQRDSSVWAYKQAFAADPNRLKTALLIAKAIVDGTVYDTAHAPPKSDTVALRRYRNAFADRLDSARAYVAKALASPDTTLRTSAALILLNGGSKIAQQAQAYDRAYPWLEQTLQLVAPLTPADTVGPRQQIRVQASFWYGIASVASLSGPYSGMIKSKSCDQAKAINDRIARTKEALILGARVHQPTANTMLQNVGKFETIMPQVKKQFKCKNF